VTKQRIVKAGTIVYGYVNPESFPMADYIHLFVGRVTVDVDWQGREVVRWGPNLWSPSECLRQCVKNEVIDTRWLAGISPEECWWGTSFRNVKDEFRQSFQLYVMELQGEMSDECKVTASALRSSFDAVR